MRYPDYRTHQIHEPGHFSCNWYQQAAPYQGPYPYHNYYTGAYYVAPQPLHQM